MKIKLKNSEIREYVVKDLPSEFPKYTTQLINLANQNSQATRPKNVGQMTELIKEFPGNSFDEWVEWYQDKHPNAIDDATDKITSMIENLDEVFPIIDRNMVKAWVEDLILVKTFIGLNFQEAILKKLSEIKGCDYRLAEPYEEAKGIDGFVGDDAYSIKPSSYDSKQFLSEVIEVKIISYEKKKDGVVFDIPDDTT